MSFHQSRFLQCDNDVDSNTEAANKVSDFINCQSAGELILQKSHSMLRKKRKTMTVFVCHSLTAAQQLAFEARYFIEMSKSFVLNIPGRDISIMSMKFEFQADRRFQCSKDTEPYTPHTIQPFAYQFRERTKQTKLEKYEKEMKSKRKYALKCKLSAAIVQGKCEFLSSADQWSNSTKVCE